jgi:hypothetical protein
MKATRALPESYLLYRHFDDTRYKKATWAAIVLGLLVFVASFAFFNNLAGTLRPEYQPVEHLDFELTLERLTILLRLLVPVAVVLILHEGIHALCLWLFTRERPIFVATFEGVGGIGVRLPSWYLPPNLSSSQTGKRRKMEATVAVGHGMDFCKTRAVQRVVSIIIANRQNTLQVRKGLL